MLHFDHLLLGAHVATMVGGRYASVANAAVGMSAGLITYLGPEAALPAHVAQHVKRVDGRWITPGLIDCHTHLIFGGNRADEFERRLQGVSYAQIASEGGGILSTVRATRSASEAELLASAVQRASALLNGGVTTLEVKSGYGLDVAHELKMLRVGRQLAEHLPVRVFTTFLGAHALHPDYQNRRDAYVDLICQEMLPQIAAEGLADATDAFCEHIAFSVAEVERIFTASTELCIPVKLHADQLSDSGGAALAARYGGLSADHVEYTNEAAVAAMAEAGTVAVLLPGAWYCLRETQLPPIELFRKHGVPMAVSTDSNPGTSPVLCLQTMLSMACTSFRLTPEEALAGVTCYAAEALGEGDTLGTLEVGKHADLVVWPIQSPAELSYWVGNLKPEAVYFKGQPRN